MLEIHRPVQSVKWDRYLMKRCLSVCMSVCLSVSLSLCPADLHSGNFCLTYTDDKYRLGVIDLGAEPRRHIDMVDKDFVLAAFESLASMLRMNDMTEFGTTGKIKMRR